MENHGRVYGCLEQAQPLIVGKDTVYVHTNIKKSEDFDGSIYEYDEVQYTKDEYIKLMSEKNTVLEKSLLKTQTSLIELYEMF